MDTSLERHPLDTVKIDVKLFADDDTQSFDSEELIPLFHRWIQDARLDDLLIDVADYRHVPDGPEVLLIGHDAQYVWDRGGGRAGLLYSRRRETHASVAGLESPAERLHSVLRAAVRVGVELQQSSQLDGKLRLLGGELLVSVNDRLVGVGTQVAAAALEEELRSLLAVVLPGVDFVLERSQDPRCRLSVHLSADREVSLDQLLVGLEELFMPVS